MIPEQAANASLTRERVRRYDTIVMMRLIQRMWDDSKESREEEVCYEGWEGEVGEDGREKSE